MNYELLFLMLFTFFACDNKNEKIQRQLMEKEIMTNVEAFKTQKYAECRATALEKANKQVDSMLIAQATMGANVGNDGSQKPTRPTNPKDMKSPLDTVAVRPILPK